MANDFPTTRWTLIVQAEDENDPRAREALSGLCQAYWHPLYVFLRKRGHTEDDARDLVQSYFVELIEKHTLRSVRPEAGRFRAFLLHTLKHFVINQRERQQAVKRGGRATHLSLDFPAGERRFADLAAATRSPEEEFEHHWALTVIDQVQKRLAAEAADLGRLREFEKLKEFLTDSPPRGAYAALAAELDVSEGSLRVAVHRLRRRFGESLREVIAETVDAPGDVEPEIRHLFDALGD